jgi:hypothetical protein
MIAKKVISYHNFHLLCPICDRKEFGIFQLLENLKKIVLMQRSVAKNRPWLSQPSIY